ncbi:hypothetical protein C8J57DRAFT_1229674 [Mycena rebaudengoi]|nr:hypothetical protein C8J57DRAFT_1229674 [Mycena rebaudengoi]
MLNHFGNQSSAAHRRVKAQSEGWSAKERCNNRDNFQQNIRNGDQKTSKKCLNYGLPMIKENYMPETSLQVGPVRRLLLRLPAFFVEGCKAIHVVEYVVVDLSADELTKCANTQCGHARCDGKTGAEGVWHGRRVGERDVEVVCVSVIGVFIVRLDVRAVEIRSRTRFGALQNAAKVGGKIRPARQTLSPRKRGNGPDIA